MTNDKKVGAPKGSRNRQNGATPATAWIQIRVEPEEKARFQEQASAEEMTLSQWILSLMRDASKKQ